MNLECNIFWSRRKTELLAAQELAEGDLTLGVVAIRPVINDQLAVDIGETHMPLVYEKAL